LISDLERENRFKEKLETEKEENAMKCMWLSFCDTDKPEGEQFLGVIIINCLGLSHAILETHEMGINPNGEIMSSVVNMADYKLEHFNKLLSKADLIEYGYA